MSFFTDAFHKITKKTHSPRIVWHSSYVVVDSKTGAHKLQGQCIQPQVGMYSVLTIGEHVDIVVRYERTLPYTLPGSSDEDLPQVTYVVPRQDMKAGDFFTLFVGREHFMVQVIQVLPKSSSDSSENFLDSSSKTDTSRARWQPVQSSLDVHSSESLPPSTGDRQDEDIPITTPKSAQQTPTPVTRPLPDHPEERVFSTRTRVDGEIVPNLTRTNAAVGPVTPVAAVSNNHPDRERSTYVKPDSFPQESSVRPSDQIHQTKPSDKDVIPLQVDVNLTRTPKGARPRSPSTSRQPPRGRDTPTPHCAISKTTRENPKPRVQRKPTIGHNNIQVPKETASTSNKNNQLQVPLPIQSSFVQVEHPLQEYAMKKPHGAYREPSKFDPPLRELSNIGRGFEIVTMEDSSVRSTHASVYSFLPDATKPKSSVSRKPSQRTKTQGSLAEHSESDIDIQRAVPVPASLDEYYDIYYLVPKRIRVPHHNLDLDRVYASTLPKRGLHT